MKLDHVAANVRWYFREAAGEMGLKSSFNSMVNRIGGVRYEGLNQEMDGRAVQAALRARGIKAILDQLSDEVNGVLLIAFGGVERQGWPRLFALMTAQSDARKAHTESKSTRTLEDWLLRLARAAKEGTDEERKRLWVRLYSTTQRTADSALRAYATTEGRQRAQAQASRLLDT